MTVLRVNGGENGVELAHKPADAGLALARAARSTPRGAPIVILIHGFMYDPDGPKGANPHGQVYAETRAAAARRASWPYGLGFTETGIEDGLCVAFAWRSRPSPLATLAGAARNHFSAAYKGAAEAAEGLLWVVATLRAARPDAEIDLFCHSLGARVALLAIRGAAERGLAGALGRVVLLGGAEFAAEARAAMAALDRAPNTSGPQVFNIITRENDPYDVLFETFAPRPADASGALGREGLGLRREDWIDLQLDHPDVERFLAQRGARLRGGRRAVCHWSFYRRPGAMRLYRRILRRREGWSIAELRAAGTPEAIEPRWAALRAAPAAWLNGLRIVASGDLRGEERRKGGALVSGAGA